MHLLVSGARSVALRILSNRFSPTSHASACYGRPPKAALILSIVLLSESHASIGLLRGPAQCLPVFVYRIAGGCLPHTTAVQPGCRGRLRRACGARHPLHGVGFCSTFPRVESLGSGTRVLRAHTRFPVKSISTFYLYAAFHYYRVEVGRVRTAPCLFGYEAVRLVGYKAVRFVSTGSSDYHLTVD